MGIEFNEDSSMNADHSCESTLLMHLAGFHGCNVSRRSQWGLHDLYRGLQAHISKQSAL